MTTLREKLVEEERLEKYKAHRKLCLRLFRMHWKRLAKEEESKGLIYLELYRKYKEQLGELIDNRNYCLECFCFLCDLRNLYHGSSCRTCPIDWSGGRRESLKCTKVDLYDTSRIAKLPIKPLAEVLATEMD